MVGGTEIGKGNCNDALEKNNTYNKKMRKHGGSERERERLEDAQIRRQTSRKTGGEGHTGPGWRPMS